MLLGRSWSTARGSCCLDRPTTPTGFVLVIQVLGFMAWLRLLHRGTGNRSRRPLGKPAADRRAESCPPLLHSAVQCLAESTRTRQDHRRNERHGSAQSTRGGSSWPAQFERLDSKRVSYGWSNGHRTDRHLFIACGGGGCRRMRFDVGRSARTDFGGVQVRPNSACIVSFHYLLV